MGEPYTLLELQQMDYTMQVDDANLVDRARRNPFGPEAEQLRREAERRRWSAEMEATRQAAEREREANREANRQALEEVMRRHDTRIRHAVSVFQQTVQENRITGERFLMGTRPAPPEPRARFGLGRRKRHREPRPTEPDYEFGYLLHKSQWGYLHMEGPGPHLTIVVMWRSGKVELRGHAESAPNFYSGVLNFHVVPGPRGAELTTPKATLRYGPVCGETRVQKMADLATGAWFVLEQKVANLQLTGDWFVGKLAAYLEKHGVEARDAAACLDPPPRPLVTPALWEFYEWQDHRRSGASGRGPA